MGFSLAQLAAQCDAEVEGDAGILIDSVANLAQARAGMLSMYTDRRYRKALVISEASAIITSVELANDFNGAKLISKEPLLVLAKVLTLFQQPEFQQPEFQGSEFQESGLHTPSRQVQPGIDKHANIHSTVILSEGVSIGANVSIAEQVVIGKGVRIGAGSVIGPGVQIKEQTLLDANVTIYASCQLGKRCHISAGAIIGADGFGFAEHAVNGVRQWTAIPQTGIVRIGDDVHIGANTTIDRGSLEDTLIADGVIIDNLVQIAHNVKIGRHTAIAGCAAIAGSTTIGENCKLGGRASIIGHLDICNDVVIFADSLVTKSIKKAGVYSSAMPAMPSDIWRKLLAKFRRGQST